MIRVNQSLSGTGPDFSHNELQVSVRNNAFRRTTPVVVSMSELFEPVFFAIEAKRSR